MQIQPVGAPRIIMENPYSRMNYFAWPTIARLKNDRLAVVASGFRLNHVCPFGKAVLSVSENEGESWTPPAVVIDTPLDDRDSGLLPFGESGLIVTSFNNTRQSQMDWINKTFAHDTDDWFSRFLPDTEFRKAYLDMVSDEQEASALGGTFRISHDNGMTFGPLHVSPIHSPHGPLELSDGTILWVGELSPHVPPETQAPYRIQAFTIDPDTGKQTYLSGIPDIVDEKGEKVPCWEPYVIQLPSGRLICHIRAFLFTLYQSVSDDMGKTWTQPQRLLPVDGGAPSHMMIHSSGTLICAYTNRCIGKPGIRLMFSTDGGETWDKDHILVETDFGADLGYPATVELHDGSLLTVYYAHSGHKEPAVIYQQRWNLLP